MIKYVNATDLTGIYVKENEKGVVVYGKVIWIGRMHYIDVLPETGFNVKITFFWKNSII